MSEAERVVDQPGDGMERKPIQVDAVDVQRAPGFVSGGVSLDDLSPGVNVVCGGNAAGKTTLSNAIRWSLWPDGDSVPDLAKIQTELTYDGEGRTVILNGGVTQHLRDGADASPIPVPSLAGGERYELSLEELLQPESDGETFADAIQRESTGGFDVSAVREELGVEDGAAPSTRNLGETQTAKDAIEKVERQRREAPDLSAERERLAEVAEELQAAADARGQARLLEQAVAFAEAREDYQAANESVAEFPTALSEFDGNEIEELERLNGDIARHEAAIWDAATTYRDAVTEMAETGLDGPVPESELETLRECHKALDDLGSTRDRLKREVTAAKERRAEAREEIPLDLDVDTLRSVETGELDDLRGFTTAVAVSEAAERAQSKVGTAFKPVTETDVASDRDTIVAGRDALAAWLAEPDKEQKEAAEAGPDSDTLRRVAVGAGLLVAAAGVAIGLTGTPLGFLLALVGGAQAVYAWRSNDDGEPEDDQTTPNPRETHRRQFPDDELVTPETWTREAVRERLSELRGSLAAVETAERAAATRDQIQAEFDDSDATDRVETTRESLQESLGADPDGIEDVELGVTVERIERWQAADTEVSSKRTELQETRGQIDTRLSEFYDRITPYETDDGYTVETAADAAGVIDSLESRSRRYNAAREQRDEVASDVAAARRELADARASYESLFTDRELTVGDEKRLRELAEKYADYTDAVQSRDAAKTVLDQRRTDLQDHDKYDPEDGVEERTVDELNAELVDVRERANEYDDLLERKNDLQSEISSVKESTDVEAAVAERDEALTALAEALEQDAGDAVADELLDTIAEETAATRQEPVFCRADELLREITNGAFELRLEDGTFQAYDTGEGRRADLDNLSTGTRVQVLLSVRVAFIELREGGTAPPLLLDDTLAVFDDLRAEEVIETVIGFASQGRQVFYFTARNDERERLSERLRDTGVAYEIHSLDGVYDDDPTAREPQIDASSTTVDVPVPDGDNHRAYREQLDIPTFDPRKGAQTAHLWYITEDPGVLYDLLSARIDRWGQLESLLDAGQVDGLLSADARDRIRRNGAALEAFTETYTVGRGDPVDRTVLEDSEAVSDTFIDEVSELAERADGDPERILDRLPDVSRFRTHKIEELREYLQEEGYLDPRETLPDETVRVAVVDAYADHGLAGQEADEAARRLLERVSSTKESSNTQGVSRKD